jgi:hypothetical protein
LPPFPGFEVDGFGPMPATGNLLEDARYLLQHVCRFAPMIEAEQRPSASAVGVLKNA